MWKPGLFSLGLAPYLRRGRSMPIAFKEELSVAGFMPKKVAAPSGPAILPTLRIPKAELHLLITGHFALEEDGARMAKVMRRFLLGNAQR